MAATDFVMTVKVDQAYLAHLEAIAVRMEAAAAAMAPVELEAGTAMMTLRTAPAGIGPITTALIAGAVLAGSTTRKVSRRAMLGVDWLTRMRR